MESSLPTLGMARKGHLFPMHLFIGLTVIFSPSVQVCMQYLLSFSSSVSGKNKVIFLENMRRGGSMRNSFPYSDMGTRHMLCSWACLLGKWLGNLSLLGQLVVVSVGGRVWSPPKVEFYLPQCTRYLSGEKRKVLCGLSTLRDWLFPYRFSAYLVIHRIIPFFTLMVKKQNLQL